VTAPLACQEGGAKNLIVDTGLNGDWGASTTVVSSTCDPEFSSYLSPGQWTYRIEQSGSSVALLIRGCCEDIPWGAGTLDGSTVTFHRQRSPVDAGPACSILLEDFMSGTVDGDRIAGETTLSITPSGTCDPGFPCEVRGTFSLDRCATPCGPLCYTSIVPCGS
jgi:hypothetical protein